MRFKLNACICMSTNKNDYYHLGLTDDEVLQSREKNGINLLTPPKRPSLWKLYLEKFEDPVVRVLLVAAVFSLIISIIENEYAETIGIIAAILLATGIGFFFEYDASKKFDLLNAVNEETLVKVIRNGRVQEIPRKDIVVGDIVILETGEEIPADGELLEAISLQVNESNLTGEPVINKTTVEADFDEEATYASNLVMRGTTVVDGHGTMRVLHVGDATEIGKVARQSTEDNLEPTPLNIQLTKLANLIGKIGFTVAGLAFLIFFVKDVLLFFDFGSLNGWHEWLPVFERTLKYFMMAVTLIVVAVPEGLPMSVTLSLALNMRRMLSTNNLVRKMHACETMGAITVICTDKTGTLTQNLMQVHEPNFYGIKNGSDLSDDDISALIAEGISANSTAFLEESTHGEKPKGVGNPTEVALLLWLNKQGRDYLQLREQAHVLDQLTFSTERKFMATLVESPLIGKKILYIKGAPEIVLGKCKEVVLDGRRVDAVEYRSTVEAQLLSYQNMAMRTLGFAFKIVGENEPNDCTELVSANDLNFLGVVAISDPIRPDVPAAVAKCQSAGIGIKIVTGDTPGTATEIARQIGLWNPETDTERNRITGVAFAELSDEDFADMFNPSDIVDSAYAWDNEELTEWFYNHVAEPNKIGGVKTSDGAIVFDKDLIRRNIPAEIVYTQASSNEEFLAKYGDDTEADPDIRFSVGGEQTDTDAEVSDADKRFAPVESAIKLLKGGADLWRTLRETGASPREIALRMATSGESDTAIRELTGLYRDALGVWTYDSAWLDAHVPDIADTRELRAGYKLGTVDEQLLGLAPEEVKASRRRLLDSAKLPADADAARVRPTAAEFAEDRKTAAAKEAARLITEEKVPSADAAIRTGALLADIADVLEKKKVRAETVTRLTAQVRGENGAWETDNSAMTKIIRAGSKQLDVQDFTDFLFENAKELTESSYNSQYGHRETYALDKLGVQIQNPIVDIAKYGTKPSELIANEREQEELKRYIENEYASAAHPSPAERADARDVKREFLPDMKTVGEVARFYLDRTKWRMLYCVCI